MELCNKLQIYMPTLRLSIIDSCNANCPFCHREGQKQYCSKNSLGLETLQSQIIPAINKLGIRKVILTGGEPSLHPDLPQIAKKIRECCDSVHLGLTTNGFDLANIQSTAKFLDRLTLSLSSFMPEVYMKYTQINPLVALSFIDKLPINNKAISIVITEDNYSEIGEMLIMLSSRAYDIKLQYVIGTEQLTNGKKYKLFRAISESNGEPRIVLGATPSLVWKTKYNTLIRLKLASLNQLQYNNIVHRVVCEGCPVKSECVEKGCAVRVYPNGSVSPCLNNYISFNGEQIIENIQKAYFATEIMI